MVTLAYRILNVFTRNGDPLSGNPLCVFENGAGLATDTMQRLARQLNLSETTFLLPSARADARVRIFTPTYEMPFAGHPTLGSAHACRALGRCGDQATLEMTAGVIPVRAQGNRWTLQANPAQTRACEVPREALAAALGLAPHDIAAPPLWVAAGKEQLIVPLASARAVEAAAPDVGKLAALAQDEENRAVYVFARTSATTVLSRFFFFTQGTNIVEDPATGSAAANLGGWLIATGSTLPQRLEISQGECVGRPSTLYLEVDAEQRIFVSGEVIELGRGTFTF